jgi:hypothetical protein
MSITSSRRGKELMARTGEILVEIRKGARWGNLKERDHLEDLGVNWRIILKWMLNKYGGFTWIGFIWQTKDKWHAVVNTVLNFRVPYNANNFFTSSEISMSRRTLFRGPG